MPKLDKIYLFIFGMIAVLYVGYELAGPEPTDWSDSYSKIDTIPYGTYILGEELSQIFPEQEVRDLIIPPFEYLKNPGFDKIVRRNWIFINNTIDPDRFELELLMGAVSRGDDLFISTSDPGAALADTLGFQVSYRSILFGADSLEAQLERSGAGTKLNFENPELERETDWVFNEQRSAYFTSVDTSKTVLLGYANDGNANYIRIDHGQGNIYIHLFPRAFTNYYLREPEYADYAFKALSYLPVRSVVWDEYYKAGRSGYSTPMGYVLSQQSLRRAWFILLAGICLFMIFKGRRVQRAIPEIKPPKNSTLEFARTIGSLYLEKGTHKEIAMKKIRFFADYCRRKLCLEISEADDDTVRKVAERSGISEPEINDLMNSIGMVRRRSDIGKNDLKDVTSKIDQFYKKSLR